AITASAPRIAALRIRAVDAGEGTGVCAAVTVEMDEAAPAPTSAPHFVQNFVAGASAAPHLVQNRVTAAASLLISRCVPHFVQNASRSVSAAPQCLQLLVIEDPLSLRRQKLVAQPYTQDRRGLAHFLIREIS